MNKNLLKNFKFLKYIEKKGAVRGGTLAFYKHKKESENISWGDFLSWLKKLGIIFDEKDMIGINDEYSLKKLIKIGCDKARLVLNNRKTISLSIRIKNLLKKYPKKSLTTDEIALYLDHQNPKKLLATISRLTSEGYLIRIGKLLNYNIKCEEEKGGLNSDPKIKIESKQNLEILNVIRSLIWANPIEIYSIIKSGKKNYTAENIRIKCDRLYNKDFFYIRTRKNKIKAYLIKGYFDRKRIRYKISETGKYIANLEPRLKRKNNSFYIMNEKIVEFEILMKKIKDLKKINRKINNTHRFLKISSENYFFIYIKNTITVINKFLNSIEGIIEIAKGKFENIRIIRPREFKTINNFLKRKGKLMEDEFLNIRCLESEIRSE